MLAFVLCINELNNGDFLLSLLSLTAVEEGDTSTVNIIAL